MLKGHTFKKQLYPTEAHMRLINMLTGGLDGILNIGNKMNITYSLTTITVKSGIAIIQGNTIEEDSSTTIDISGMRQDYGTLSLVIEIDLDKENTEEELKQVSYKVLEGRYDYPLLTKDNIVESGAGVYQYELARFNTSGIGITDMIDRRTYMDLATVFSNTQEIKPVLKSDFCCIEKEHKSTESTTTQYTFSYPEGFNKDNTVVVQVAYCYYGYAINNLWEFGSAGIDKNTISVSLYDKYILVSHIRECDNLRVFIAKKSAISIVQASEVS